MEILSRNCIQLDDLSPEQMGQLYEKINPELEVARLLADSQRKEWIAGRTRGGAPIGELKLREERVLEINSAMPARAVFEIARSRFNAVMHCGNVITHTDDHAGWTWLTYLDDRNQEGAFYMGGEKGQTIDSASLLLPVRQGTSFCFDNQYPHGFDIDVQGGAWVPFLSLIVTRDSVMEILDSQRSGFLRSHRSERDREVA